MITTRAFILRTVDYGESDRILTLYTRERGQVSAMARSARSSRKRFGGALEPFAEFEAVLHPATRGHLLRLSEAMLINAHYDLCADYTRLDNAARMITRLRSAVGESQADPALFDFVARCVSAMERADGMAPRIIALIFSMALSEHCGFGLSIHGCNACGSALPEGRSAFFDPARGGVVCTACGGGPILLNATGVALLQRLSRMDPDSADIVPVSEAELLPLEEAFDLFFRHQFR